MIDLAAHFPTLARLARPLGPAWRWWTAELAALLPRRAALGPLAIGRRRPVAALVGPHSLVLSSAPDNAVMARLPLPLPADVHLPDLAGRPVELRIAAASVLRTTLRLPAAAEENLRQVIAYEMDRETPFKAEDVRFDAHITAREGRQIRVDLLIVPKPLAERAMAAAARLQLSAVRLTVDGKDTATFDLRTAEERPAARRPSRLLVGLTGALTAALLATPPALNLWQASRLDALIAPVQQRADLTLRMRDELDRRSGAASSLDALKRQTTPMVTLLAELSERLPDGVWLDQLRVAQGEVRLTGYAPNAAALIALLEASPLLAKVRFETDVTQDPQRRRERFQIVAMVERPTP